MNCPRCGGETERGQLVCLECGGRLALKPERDERRSFENVPAIALLLCVVVIGAAAFGFALSELTDGSGGQSSAADRPEPSTPAASTGSPQTETETGASQQPSRSLLLEWPDGVSADTSTTV